jgi:hypothetical protein
MYKGLEELRDVLRLRKLTGATPRRLYVFEECGVSLRAVYGP